MIASAKSWLALAALAGVMALHTAAFAQDIPEMSFRYATGFPKALYMTKPVEFFAEKVKEKSGGNITIKTYYAGALGKSDEILDLVGKGAIDMGSVVQGYFTSALPFGAMTNSLPMTFFDGEAVMRAAMKLDETNKDQIAEFERNNIIPLVHRYLPNYRLICTMPIRTMADLKGKKIRTFGNYMPHMFAALEVTPVNVLPTEMYEALKRGSLDCSYLTNANFIAYKLHEVAKYIIDVKLGGINAYWLAMNRSKFFALPENIQSLLRDAGAEATQYSVDITVAEEEAALQQMVAEGAEVVKFEEQEAVEAAVPDMIDIWIENMTKDGKGEEAKAYAAELKALLGMQ
jgi:TRAP-type C4-dicarboxylate transport system substrate-binding protein